MTTLRPGLVERLVNASSGLGILAIANVLFSAAPGWFGPTVAVFAGACGIVWTARAYRLSVTVTRDHVVIRNLFRTHAVPRPAIVDVTDLATVYWKSSGSMR